MIKDFAGREPSPAAPQCRRAQSQPGSCPRYFCRIYSAPAALRVQNNFDIIF
jgi:hypothetical protein